MKHILCMCDTLSLKPGKTCTFITALLGVTSPNQHHIKEVDHLPVDSCPDRSSVMNSHPNVIPELLRITLINKLK